MSKVRKDWQKGNEKPDLLKLLFQKVTNPAYCVFWRIHDISFFLNCQSKSVILCALGVKLSEIEHSPLYKKGEHHVERARRIQG